MALTDKKEIIKLIMDDQFSPKLKEVDRNFKNSMSSMSKSANSSTSSVISSMRSINVKGGEMIASFGASVLKAGAIVGGLTVGVGLLANSFVKTTAKSENLGRYFEESFGKAEVALEKLRLASKGTISDISLMEISNKASLLGITNSVDEMAGLMLTARLRGKAMGMETTQAFNDIVTGIGRGSPLILDNLGIKIPEALKLTMEGMTEVEKTQALLNFAIKDGAILAEQLGGDVLTTADKYEILSAQIENTKTIIGEALIPVFNEVADYVLPKVNEWIEIFGDTVEINLENSKGFWAEYREYLKQTAEDGSWASKISDTYFSLVEDVIELKDAIKTNLEKGKGFWSDYAQQVKKDALTQTFSINGIIGSLLRLYDTLVKVGNAVANFTTLGISGKIQEYQTKNRAIGGMASGLTLVGEQGPELLNLPRGTRVYNNDDTQRRMGGNQTININIGEVDSQDRVQQIVRAIQSLQDKENILGNYNLT